MGQCRPVELGMLWRFSFSLLVHHHHQHLLLQAPHCCNEIPSLGIITTIDIILVYIFTHDKFSYDSLQEHQPWGWHPSPKEDLSLPDKPSDPGHGNGLFRGKQTSSRRPCLHGSPSTNCGLKFFFIRMFEVFLGWNTIFFLAVDWISADQAPIRSPLFGTINHYPRQHKELFWNIKSAPQPAEEVTESNQAPTSIVLPFSNHLQQFLQTPRAQNEKQYQGMKWYLAYMLLIKLLWQLPLNVEVHCIHLHVILVEKFTKFFASTISIYIYKIYIFNYNIYPGDDQTEHPRVWQSPEKQSPCPSWLASWNDSS